MDLDAVQYEPKCWGSVAHFFASDHAAVSHLRVKEGYQCSRHRHKDRANLFFVISGRIIIKEYTESHGRLCVSKTWMKAGHSYMVPSGVLHQFQVEESGEVIEVYWPDRGGTVRLDDIERLDEGGRVAA